MKILKTAGIVALLLVGLPLFLGAQQLADVGSQAAINTTTGIFNPGPVDVGAGPADAATGINMSSNEAIWWEASPAGTDISAINVDAAEIVQIGETGASAVRITPDLEVVGDLVVTGTGAHSFNGNIVPLTDNARTLGASALHWQNVLTNLVSADSALQVGSAPASSGAVRLSNGENISWEAAPASTDVVGILVDAAEIVQIAPSGASAVVITPPTTVTGALTAVASVISPLYSVANTSESAGRANYRTTREVHTLAAANTSDTTTISILVGSELKGCQFTVNTAVVDSAGDDTWSAAFITGSTTSLASGAAAAQNTKVNTLIVSELATDTVQVRFTANGGNFSAGVIELVCYYVDLTSLGDV